MSGRRRCPQPSVRSWPLVEDSEFSNVMKFVSARMGRNGNTTGFLSILRPIRKIVAKVEKIADIKLSHINSS